MAMGNRHFVYLGNLYLFTFWSRILEVCIRTLGRWAQLPERVSCMYIRDLFFSLFNIPKAGEKYYCLYCLFFHIISLSCTTEIYVRKWGRKISLTHVWGAELHHFLGIKTRRKKEKNISLYNPFGIHAWCHWWVYSGHFTDTGLWCKGYFYELAFQRDGWTVYCLCIKTESNCLNI